MPTDATILVSQGTDRALDYESLTVSGQTVYRQRLRLAGSGAAAMVEALNTDPAGTEYGLLTRMVGAVAPGTVESSNYPAVRFGGSASHAVPAAVAGDGYRQSAWMTRYGAQVEHSFPAYGQIFVAGEGMVSQQTAIFSANTNAAALISGVASKYIYLLGLWGTCGTAGILKITRTTGGATQWVRWLPNNGIDSVAPAGFYLAKSSIGDGLSFTNSAAASQHDLAALYVVSSVSF